jgi:hypothetical protein
MNIARKATNVVDIYMKGLSMLHEFLKETVLDKDPKFTFNFWKGLFKGFRTNLNFGTMYHPMSDGKIERTNRIIEDMLRVYVMDQPSKLEYYIHLVEFA